MATGVGFVVTLWRAGRSDAEPLSLILGMGLLIALVHADLWLWRRFRTHLLANPTDRFTGFVYGRGVFGFGLVLWMGMAFFQAFQWAGERYPRFTSQWMEAAAFFLLPSLAIGLIFSLVAGYYWGRLMASVFGLRRRRTA